VCGRYAAAKDTATLVEEFEIDDVVDPAPAPSYNVAPTDQVAFVVDRPHEDAPVQRQLRLARWGLVPSWSKDAKGGARMINARWEQAQNKPAFRAAFAKRRCLIPADGYYEWYRTQAEPGSGRPAKQPFYLHRDDGRSLGLAGLYEFWREGPDAPWLVTVTVLTGDAVGGLRTLHDRMPVVIDPQAYDEWLDPTAQVGPDFPGLLDPSSIVARPVGTAVNSVRNNGAHLLDPLPVDIVPGQVSLPWDESA
jgi:putative SOS response-associated peptidase YedK